MRALWWIYMDSDFQPAQAQSADEVDNLIRIAMLQRRPISVVYGGGQRLVCPHMLGRNKEGQLRVLCYQYGGESARGLRREQGLADWRCLCLDWISSVP